MKLRDWLARLGSGLRSLGSQGQPGGARGSQGEPHGEEVFCKLQAASLTQVSMFATIGYILPEYWRCLPKVLTPLPTGCCVNREPLKKGPTAANRVK